MHYVSTRDASLRYTAAHAIEQGLIDVWSEEADALSAEAIG